MTNTTIDDDREFYRDVGELLFFIFILGFGFCLGIFGLVANIINILVFFRQGFSEATNISFFSLAIADAGCAAANLWRSLCFNRFLDFTLTLDRDFTFFTGVVLRTLFVKIGWWMKTFISLERCLCIVMPFRIKQLATPFKTGVIMTSICIVVSVAMFPFIAIVPRFYDHFKTTVLARTFKTEDRTLEQIAFSCSLFIQFAPFALEIVSTVIMVRSLKAMSKWRNQTLSNVSARDGLSLRDKKLIKLVSFMSAIFIICTTPSNINSMAGIFFTNSYVIAERYKGLIQITFAIVNAMESINSSVSIFIYYTMSARFKEIFTEIMCRR